jgi:hypothetical protein
LDQLVKGVVEADDEVELDELPPPAHATTVSDNMAIKIFFTIFSNFIWFYKN